MEYKSNKPPFASRPPPLAVSLVRFSPRAPRNLLQMTAQCPENPPLLPVSPPMAVFRPAGILSTPLPANSGKAVLAEQTGLWGCASIGHPYLCIQRRILLQMVQYLPDDRGILNAGDDVHGMSSQLIHRVFIQAIPRQLTVLGISHQQSMALQIPGQAVRNGMSELCEFIAGKSLDFIVHRIAAARGVSNLENLTNLDQLPPTGVVVFALPMKIEGGSGGSARVVALVTKKLPCH